MKLKLLFKIIIILIIPFLSNCKKLQLDHIPRVYKKDELDKLLHIGMSQDAVTNKFGEPTAGRNSKTYLYTVDPSKIQPKPGEFYINGFCVNFDNNKKVINWDILMSRDILYKRKSSIPNNASSSKPLNQKNIKILGGQANTH